MAENHATEMTILLADVAGSVHLYDTLGDERAHNNIVQCLRFMTTVVEQNNGRVVEIVGDEIMCAFEDPNSAIKAACAIQEGLETEQQSSLSARIGLHAGITGMENGHPFGDTVNIAARMVGLAKTGQAIMTKQVYERLSADNKINSRYFDQVYVKGKRQPYSIYEAIWDQNESTMMITSKSVRNRRERPRPVEALRLHYQTTEKVLTEANAELLLGRGKQCGLQVESMAASRVHAIISFQRGKIILLDRSTNGTYIRIQTGNRNTDGSDLFCHHEEWRDQCDGVISLGEPVTDQNENLIDFKCVY